MTVHLPLTLVAELTYRCPLRCPYCSNPVDHNAPHYRQELTTDSWLRVLHQAAELGIIHIGFTGGEPLLRQDLELLVKASATAGLYTTLVTAGTLLTLDRAAQLQRCGLDHVQISIQDSQEKLSNAIAGTSSFAKKISAARVVKELGLPLTINVVLHRHNLDRIDEILELCETLNADRVELANTQYYGWAWLNRTALLPTHEQLKRAEHAVAAAQQRSTIPMGILYVLPDYYENYPKPCMGGWGQKTIVIAPNGSALPCQAASAISGLNFDNICDRSLGWIWHESEPFTRFRGTTWMSEPCRSCSRQSIDFGGCRCQAFLITGEPTATDPVCHLSPHHHLVLDAQEQSLSKLSPHFIHRSMQ